jgi:zinc transport system substrate-binding protein
LRTPGLPLLALLLAAAAAGCSPPTARDSRPVVAVSVLPFAAFVEALASDRVSLEVMIPPGANPASYEPTLPQLQRLSRAVLFVKVGHPRFPFEAAWLARLLAERTDLPVVDASAGVEALGDDPHLWVSPRRVRAMAPALADGLVGVLPEHREAILAARVRFEREIDALDAELAETLAPVRGQRFWVYHPAWGHLAADYGLVQRAIEAEGKEPDARALAARLAEARGAGVSVVFAQPQFDAASARVVAAEIGARVELLDPLAPDWADNLRRVARALAEAAVP